MVTGNELVMEVISGNALNRNMLGQSAIACSKSTVETVEQGVKYVQIYQ